MNHFYSFPVTSTPRNQHYTKTILSYDEDISFLSVTLTQRMKITTRSKYITTFSNLNKIYLTSSSLDLIQHFPQKINLVKQH